ncbi:glycerophosphodiester phosphodiesterase domain-containing protein 4 [Microtus ochrogaster]|uniref:Glycerophosphodiester phosphodiesterase domain-containing protein 4 n=2 Tax=Microtus ochrogaster TaxID=79684 RepID=A0ABM1AP13_MICOH|nr:glycerophosphodiester phosphodiesterase domain-containing protein 4 [Microtus ochrogaster]
MNKDTLTESRSKTTGKSDEHPNLWTERFFNRRCCITFLTGCYSCHWQYREWEKTELGSCCCAWKEQFFYMCLVVAFVLSVIFLFVWVETSNEYNSFDWVVYLGAKRWFLWSIFMLSIAGILTAYTSLLLLLSFFLLWERIELYLHTCHKVFIFLVILLCSFLLYVLNQYWTDKWLIAGLSLQIIAPFLHLSLITVMILLSWPLAICVAHLESEVRIRRYRMAGYEHEVLETCNIFTRLKALQVAAGLPFFVILLCLYLIPLGIYSPCILKKENLGPKPTFFGHRGAPMLAPENTMMSFEKAVEHGASGLETDVYLSYDAVPFLMHDYDLSRTTNIREVLPSAAFDHTATFNWTFLSTLNAGQWFIKHKPFFGMKPLSEADKRRASNQSIPSLAELLELAKNEKKFVIFDLFGPPPKHPLRNTFVRRVVKVILDSNIEQHLIFWLPGYDRDYVRFKAPGFQHVGRLRTLEELAKENMTIINVDYKRLFYRQMVRQYQAAKIHINMYIVNEPWLFSLAWCNRINSVTTDNIQVLNQLSHPLFFMTPGYYTFIWLFMVITSAIIIGVVFYYHWVKELKKEKWLKDTTSASADVESKNLPKGESEIQGASQLPKKPPARAVRSPWTPEVHYESSARSGKNPPDTSHFARAPNERPVPFKNTVKPLMLTENFQHTQTPTREPSSENTLPTLKEDELGGAFTEESRAKTDPKTPVSDSSEGSYEPLDGAISTISDKMSLKQE